MINEYQQKAMDALTDAPNRLVAIVSNSTPEGLVEQSEALCRRFDCEATGLGAAMAVAKSYAPDSHPIPAVYGKVGTELAKLIPDWAIQFKDGCGCKDMQIKMDRWGIAGCEAHRYEIVTHLLSQSDMLVPVLRAVPIGMRKVAAERLLNKAIKNARG